MPTWRTSGIRPGVRFIPPVGDAPVGPAGRVPRRRLLCRPGGRPGFARSSGSSRPSATHLWALLAEGGVRDRLQRLVQAPQLVRDSSEALGVVEPPVVHVDLLDQLVQALQHGVELAVVEWLPLGHARDSTSCYRAGRWARERKRMPIRMPAESIATSIGDECRPLTKCWWISSVAA